MHPDTCHGTGSATRRTRRIRVAVVVISMIAAAGCGGSGDDSDAIASTVPDTAPDTLPVDLFTHVTDVPAGGALEEAPATSQPGETLDADLQPVDVGTTVIPVVPETGVPGLESADDFCRAWSEFAGTFQALGLVSAVGDATAAIRLEVIASPAVTAAVARMDASLPPGLEQERRPLIDDFAGPFGRRADKAQLELGAAGVTALEDLQIAWLEQLAQTGVDDPNMVIVLPASVDAAAIDVAAAAFGALFPGIVEDPSLVTDVAIPLTEQYLAANCPDQGILGGNDVIDS